MSLLRTDSARAGERTAAFAAEARAPATRRAYASDWRDFMDWAAQVGASPMPATPSIVGRYLADRAADLKPATLERRLSAILVRHRQAGHPLDRRHPEIADVFAGIKRAVGTAPAQKEALWPDEIREMVAALPPGLAGRRDRALLLLWYAGALRRSEVAALETADIRFTSEGIVLCLRRGKEDQEGRSELKGIPFGANEATCPVRAVRAWLIAARLGEGPLLRRIDRHGNLGAAGLSGEACAEIVKRAVRRMGERMGWTKAEIAWRVASVAGHSLRAGALTAAAAAGASEWELMAHSLHRKSSSLRRYLRRASLFDRNPAGRLGL